MIRKLFAVAAIAMAIASVQGVASADPAPQKELCKNGGYAGYVDPTTNLPFNSQSRCVSFVNAGGTLMPVPVYTPSIGVTTYDPDENGVFGYSLALDGFAPSSELTVVTHTAAGDASYAFTTDGAGHVQTAGRFVAQCGDEVSVTASTTGATLTAGVPNPASCQESGATVTFSEPDRGYGLNILVEGLNPAETVQLKYVYANGEVGTIGGFTASATGVVELLEYSGGLRGVCWMEPIHIDVVRADGSVDSSAPYFYPDCR